GKEFPQNPIDQLKLAIKLALESWTSRKAIEYRKKNRIPETIGMGVLIMEMKFGNINERSGAGVLFTRDPNTGENRLVGDFQISVQGDEIVLGKIVTLKLDELKEILPNAYNNLYEYSKKLERHFKDALDIEFTIEDGKVWILQVRSCRKTPEALVKILVDMVHEGIITKEEAIANVDPNSLKELLYYRIDAEEKRGAIEEGRLFCECIGASPGVGVGSLKFIPPLKPFSEKDVEGKILVFDELKPSYVMRLRRCEGIIVIRGGSSSHAIILARAIGKPVVILGDSNVLCDVSKGFLSNGVITLSENDEVTIDGLRGEIYIGMLYKKEPILIDEFYELVSYADEFSGAIEIRANVESPTDIRDLHEWNINKINVRTEIREIIYQFVTADTADEKREVLRRLLRIQKDFFKKFLNKFNSGIITFKLIDPPFHEFLPDLSPLLREFYYNLYAKKNHDPKLESLIKKVTSLQNRNPMLGFRGIRIGIVCPEIYLFQVRSLLEALFEEGKTYNGDPKVRILIPNVINAKEFSYVRRIIEQAIENFNKRNYTQYDIPIGAVIETPASIINIVDISRHADFLVLGTNDLTQLILGMGRDDSEKFFLRDYIEKNLLSDNPFLKLDDSVVRFIENGLKELRQNNIDIEIGIAGEHSNDLDSVKKCIKLGIDYISVNSKIIPISKIIVAKAFLETQKESS
ncbi:MAG: putative PEP-binding protein, partial [Candidatus Njordarchaeota archaeon]